MQQPGEPRVASSCLKVGSLGQPARAVETPQKPRPRGRLRARRRPRSIVLRLRARGGWFEDFGWLVHVTTVDSGNDC